MYVLVATLIHSHINIEVCRYAAYADMLEMTDSYTSKVTDTVHSAC